jgi:hypothetical protein
MRIRPGRLKCVTAWSGSRSLSGLVEGVLKAHVPTEDIRHLHGGVFLVYTEAETAALRDWLIRGLEDGESAFVVEFEQWSGYGPGPDRRWLLDRGH